MRLSATCVLHPPPPLSSDSDSDSDSAFARTVRDSLLADPISCAEPLTGVHLTRSTVNRRPRPPMMLS
ncbi:hypothetical protein [Streptomyces sp. NPDC058308]|uniref:hypothetical protein n=1 Tax=Streptomyces sp. NPDC058308 TaxID=3346440 RepID=UPI0036EBC8F8